MKYQSSRGGAKGASFEEVLFAGYAPDGGLYVPETLPEIPKDLLMKWKDTPPKYTEVVFEVVKLFSAEDELPRDVLKDCIAKAYSGFDIDDVIGLHKCKGPTSSGSAEYTVVEMYRGRTKSFKDYALSLVGRLMEYYVGKHGKNVIVVVGTSGDTGSAAIEAVRGLKGIDIIVLLPKGKISEVQLLQMVTVPEDNVHVFEVEGTSDDLDVPIKECFPQKGLVSINSINWARIMIQASHYIFLCARENLQPVDIYVPSGAGGNLSGGLVAALLGLPINLFPSQNANDNVVRFVNKGELIWGGEVSETFANAMDIRHPYNVERLIYFNSNSETVVNTINNLKMAANNEKISKIPDDVYEKVKDIIKGGMQADQDEILNMIRDCWEVNKYLICPHTATAVSHFLNNAKNSIPNNKPYIIATASPAKFPNAIVAAKLSKDSSDSDPSQIGKELLEELRSRKIKETKTMKKGENWQKILQAEIDLIRNKKEAN